MKIFPKGKPLKLQLWECGLQASFKHDFKQLKLTLYFNLNWYLKKETGV